MKILIIAILFIFPIALFAQGNIVGSYRESFGSRIQLNADNTFKYTWNFDMSTSWTKGTWSLTGDTVYFHMFPTYDTLSQANANGITFDSLILSTGEIPERFTQAQFVAMRLSSGGQNRITWPEKLLFKKKRLYKINNGKLVVKKQRGFWSEKKWNPWFFKSED